MRFACIYNLLGQLFHACTVACLLNKGKVCISLCTETPTMSSQLSGEQSHLLSPAKQLQGEKNSKS